MAQVRQGVDAIDRELVALLSIRQRYMGAAARIKPDREHVRDDARIADVIGKVRAEARACGLCEATAEAVWRVLIDRSIAYELDRWDAMHSVAGSVGRK